jgi:carbon-monoxide dehydrogenase large subunit
VLEVSVADLHRENGKFHVTGDPSAAVTIQNIAMRAHGASDPPDSIAGPTHSLTGIRELLAALAAVPG